MSQGLGLLKLCIKKSSHKFKGSWIGKILILSICPRMCKTLKKKTSTSKSLKIRPSNKTKYILFDLKYKATNESSNTHALFHFQVCIKRFLQTTIEKPIRKY